MSDIEEDNMDVDVSDAHTFTSQQKGKRITADLPVTLEDNLPWVEKYRPQTLNDVSGHTEILQTINRFISLNRLPHLLLYGPPGTGKTSTILALARRIYGAKNTRQMVLELNASDDRGIDVVREQIKTFSSTKQIFSSFGTGTSNEGQTGNIAAFKLIILDEADAMTSTAQMALRRIMEKYTPNTRFCIIANYTHKLSPALLSRCTRFRFSPLPPQAIRGLVDRVIETEKVNIAPEATEALVRLARGDMRRALNVLQACHASTKPMPVPGKAAGAGAGDVNGEGEVITSETIHDCIASPHPEDIAMIRDTLLSTSDVASCLRSLQEMKVRRGLALADMVSSLAEELAQLEVPAQTRVEWMTGLAEIEARLSSGGSERLQMGGMVGVVRRGVELMDNK